MIEITDKKQCCGCGTCAVACPTQAIVLRTDSEGFRYPVVDVSICISCGKCVSVCPMFLNPMLLDQAYIDNDYEKIRRENVHSCINCGCCSYVCPSNRFLAQRISAAKAYDKKNKGETK